MHLNTRTCGCGYEFTKQNIKPPLLRPAQGIGNKQKNFYGGNVDRSCAADCPECGKSYLLWIKQVGQSWKVVTISANGWDPNTIAEEAAGPIGVGLTYDTAIQALINDLTDEIDVVQTLLDADENTGYPSATFIVQEQSFVSKGDTFDEMEKDALKAWLDERSIKYHPQTGEKKLRDACRAALIEIADKENEQ